jgi:hypothetical protein
MKNKNLKIFFLSFLFFLLFFTFFSLERKEYFFSDPSPIDYNLTGLDIQYHKTEAQIRIDEDEPQNFIDILDNSGKRIKIPMDKCQNTVTYYKAGTYPYGTANYVPSYTDSILLSTVF